MRHRLSKTCQRCAPRAAKVFTYCQLTTKCGHGFWQFTPELFHSLYSQANGYSETTVFLASYDNEAHWYEVRHRAMAIASLSSRLDLCTFSVGRRGGAAYSHDRVQQSDYVYALGPQRHHPA